MTRQLDKFTIDSLLSSDEFRRSLKWRMASPHCHECPHHVVIWTTPAALTYSCPVACGFLVNKRTYRIQVKQLPQHVAWWAHRSKPS